MAEETSEITENVRRGVDLREHLEVKFDIVEGLEEAREKKRPYLMRVRAHLADGDVINENTNLYPTPVLSDAAQALDATLHEGTARGLDGHPTETTRRGVGNTVFIWQRVWMEGRALKGEAIIPNTDDGRNVAAVAAAGGAVPISLRGRGDMGEQRLDESSPYYTLNTEHLGRTFNEVLALRFKTFDSVDEPGFSGAGVNGFEEMRAIVESLNASAAEQEHEVPDEKNKEGTENQTSEEGTETLESVKAELEEARAAAEKLETENKELRESVETKATETAEAIEEAKRELKDSMVSEDDRKLLESLRGVDADKLKTVLSIVSGADESTSEEEKTPEQRMAEELEKRDLVHQTRIDALVEENKKLHEAMEAEKLEREKAAQKAALSAHVAEAVKAVPEASREKYAAWLLKRCGTPEAVDAEMKELVEELGLAKIIEGREETQDDKPKGTEETRSGSYNVPPDSDSKTEDPLDAYVSEHVDGWLAKQGVAVSEEVAS